MSKTQLVIIGGGISGSTIAKALKNKDIDIILIDKANYTLFQPLLKKVAVSTITPYSIATPYDSLLKSNNIKTILGEVTSIDKEKKEVFIKDKKIRYDYLVISSGLVPNIDSYTSWKEHLTTLKTLNDAINIKHKLLHFLEKLKNTQLTFSKNYITNFVIIGSGTKGVEFTSCLYDMFDNFFSQNKQINPSLVKIYLIEKKQTILPNHPTAVATYTYQHLTSKGITILTSTEITNINSEGIFFDKKFIKTNNIFWSAENVGSSYLDSLDANQSSSHTLIVDSELNISGHPEIFVIGDIANLLNEQGKILPKNCNLAKAQGKYVAYILKNRLFKNERPYFKYTNNCNVIALTKSYAIFSIKNFILKGKIAWMIWWCLNIYHIPGIKNKISIIFHSICSFLKIYPNTKLINLHIKQKNE
jgi:NADH:ubiquinone reductase (H+-translocating)